MSESPSTSPATEATKPKRWSDRKADTVGVLVIFAALVLAAVYYISGGVGS